MYYIASRGYAFQGIFQPVQVQLLKPQRLPTERTEHPWHSLERVAATIRGTVSIEFSSFDISSNNRKGFYAVLRYWQWLNWLIPNKIFMNFHRGREIHFNRFVSVSCFWKHTFPEKHCLRSFYSVLSQMGSEALTCGVEPLSVSSARRTTVEHLENSRETMTSEIVFRKQCGIGSISFSERCNESTCQRR